MPYEGRTVDAGITRPARRDILILPSGLNEERRLRRRRAMKYLLSEAEYEALKRDAEMWRNYAQKDKNELFSQTMSAMEEWNLKRFPQIMADTELGALMHRLQAEEHAAVYFSDGRWRAVVKPPDVYAGDTPEEALRSALEASAVQ